MLWDGETPWPPEELPSPGAPCFRPSGGAGWVFTHGGAYQVSKSQAQLSDFTFTFSFLYNPTLTSCMTTGKTIALTRRTLVDKVMSLLFNILSRLVISFLPRSKHLLISWLQSPSAVILEPKKIKSVIVPIVSPSICHEVMGSDAMILVFWCWVLSQLFHSPL